MITAEKIKPYLEDYEKATGNATEHFICPITLKECDVTDLIEAHILNKGFNKASKRTIIQYGPIDHFYGTRVEESFVTFVNSKDHDATQIIAAAECLEIEFEDGTTAPCFPAVGASARHAEGKLPRWSARIDGVEHSFFINTKIDDPRLNPRMKLLGKSRQCPPAHWTASMLKAGYLTVFDMIGYDAVYSPCGNTLRLTLKSYYSADSTREDAEHHFAEFQYATKFAGTGTVADAAHGNYRPLRFDSLARRELLFHYTPLKNLFAMTCVFQINDVSATVSLPAAFTEGDIATSWSYYTRLVNDEHPPQQVHLAKYRDGQFSVSKQALNVHLLPDDEVRAILESQ